MISTRETRDGFLIVKWRGERVGSFDHRGSGFVSGVAIYGSECFSTDDYSEDGIPLEWIEPKVRAMCERVEAREKARAA